MKDIFTAPFVEEMRQTTANMYRLGWDERNGGNSGPEGRKGHCNSFDDYAEHKNSKPEPR